MTNKKSAPINNLKPPDTVINSTNKPKFCEWFLKDTLDLSEHLFLPNVVDHTPLNIKAGLKFPSNIKNGASDNRKTFTSFKFESKPSLYNYYDVLQYLPPQDDTATLDTHIKMHTSINTKICKLFKGNNNKKTKILPQLISRITADKLIHILSEQKKQNLTYYHYIQDLILKGHVDRKTLLKIGKRILKLNTTIDADIKGINLLKFEDSNIKDLGNLIDANINDIKVKYERKFIEITHATRCQKVQIIPNKFQKAKILEWSKNCDKVYDACVDIFNNDKANFSKNHKTFKLFVFNKVYGTQPNLTHKSQDDADQGNSSDNDSAATSDNKDNNQKSEKKQKNIKDVPYNILTDVVKEFCSNVKSCESNMENSNIKGYKMGPKNPTRQHISLGISTQNISFNGIYSTILGKMNEFNTIATKFNINRDCRLTYDRYFDKFHICIPFYVPLIKTNKINAVNDSSNIDCSKLISKTKIKKMSIKQTDSEATKSKKILIHVNDARQKYCALDPGEKIFQTYYGESTCGNLGEDMRDIILNYRAIIGKYKRILRKGTNKQGSRLTSKTRKYLLKQIRIIYERMKNIVSELHNKTILFLCKNFNTILIPKFQTQSMLKKNKIATFEHNVQPQQVAPNKNKRQLPKKTKYVLNMLSHYKFRTKLIQKAKEYQCKVHEVTEEYTSMCCGKCGFLSANYNKNREKSCKNCSHKINRDINGARNILLLNKELIFKRYSATTIKKNTKMTSTTSKSIPINNQSLPKVRPPSKVSKISIKRKL